MRLVLYLHWFFLPARNHQIIKKQPNQQRFMNPLMDFKKMKQKKNLQNLHLTYLANLHQMTPYRLI
jgi:hypothetical protein